MEVCCAALRMEYQKRGNQIDFIGIILIFFEACAGLDSKHTKEIPFFYPFHFLLDQKVFKIFHLFFSIDEKKQKSRLIFSLCELPTAKKSFGFGSHKFYKLLN